MCISISRCSLFLIHPVCSLLWIPFAIAYDTLWSFCHTYFTFRILVLIFYFFDRFDEFCSGHVKIVGGPRVEYRRVTGTSSVKPHRFVVSVVKIELRSKKLQKISVKTTIYHVAGGGSHTRPKIAVRTAFDYRFHSLWPRLEGGRQRIQRKNFFFFYRNSRRDYTEIAADTSSKQQCVTTYPWEYYRFLLLLTLLVLLGRSYREYSHNIIVLMAITHTHTHTVFSV